MIAIILLDLLMRAAGLFLILEGAWLLSRLLAAVIWRNDA